MFKCNKCEECKYDNGKRYYLYVHISPSNKRYYGITSEDKVQDRWLNGKGYHRNEHFTNAINKYGWENFQHIVLFDNLTKEEACLLEQMYIALYDTANKKYGYNNSLGGEHGLASEQTKKKISESLKGENNPNYGRQFTEEHRKKLSESKKGGVTKGKNNGMAKAVLMFTKEGEFIRMFECVPDAIEFLGKPRDNTNINTCARARANGRNTTAYGYIWIYEEDYIKEQEQDK